MCVCKWGYAACTVSIPSENCDDCGTLIDAIWSYLAEMWRRFFEADDPTEEPDPEAWW